MGRFIVGRMRALLSLVCAATLGQVAWGEGITQVTLGNHTYTNISKVYIGAGNRVIILFPGGGTSAMLDKLPQDFLGSWGIGQDKQAAANTAVEEQAAKNLDRAIQSGCFRKVHGVVFDTRKQQSGWVMFQNVKVYQIVTDGALVNSTPNDDSTIVPILVRNLPATVGDSDYISFVGLPDGTYSYENKRGDDRVVRAYDVGQICDRSEIPESVLSGARAYDVPVGRNDREAMARDVVASLPESEDLAVSGSGFFITEDGYFITNAHVVKNAHRVKIKQSGNVLPAVVVREDALDDLALLKVAGNFKPLGIATNEVDLGQAVFTIGFPDIRLQGTEPKYTDGKISSLNGLKDDPTEYQISVPVQPGNSGGPLVDANGNVEGVIVARLNDFAALASVGSLPQNVNYAIKSSVLTAFLRQTPEVKPPVAVWPGGPAVQTVKQAVAMVLVY